jgi:uncharacterized protein YgiM (DUF1202 family)
MKKIIFSLALLFQTAFAFADGQTTARAHYDNVKMYRQPGTSTEVVKALKSSDELVVVRKFNNYWSIVTVDGEVGYVLTSELSQPKVQKNTMVAKR